LANDPILSVTYRHGEVKVTELHDTRTSQSSSLTRAFTKFQETLDLRQQLGDLLRQLARVYGLGDVAVAASVERLLVVALHREGGERDDPDVAGAFVGLEFARERESVYAGQGYVHEDQFWQSVGEDDLRLLGVPSLEDLVALEFEQFGNEFEIGGVVVNDEDFRAPAKNCAE
jgi:hypothetical protein